MNLVYSVNGTLFTTQAVAITSIAISYHAIAKQIIPNAVRDRCTILFKDRRRKPLTVHIVPTCVHDKPEHL